MPGEDVKTLDGNLYGTLLHGSFISTQTILVKRSAFEQTGGFREDMPRLQDWELVLRLAKLGMFCCVKEPLVLVFATPGNLTSDVSKGISARLKILEIHAAEFEKRPSLLRHHYHVIGKQLLTTGDPAGSAKYFLKAIKLNPLGFNSWFWLGVAYSKSFFQK